MSEQTRHDELRDPRVSEVYRELSNEETSAKLDRNILDMAEAGAPSRSLTRLLAVKPLAWAATVLLTVTLVVHLQQETPHPEALLYEEDVMTDAVPLPAAPERAIKREAQQVVAPASSGRQDDVAADTGTPTPAAARDADADAARAVQSFAPAAETRAKMQEVEAFVAERERSISSVTETPEPTVSIQGRRSAAPEPRYCSEAETADASSWYRCILKLTEDGKLDEAAAERTKLFSAFPDFEVR